MLTCTCFGTSSHCRESTHWISSSATICVCKDVEGLQGLAEGQEGLSFLDQSCPPWHNPPPVWPPSDAPRMSKGRSCQLPLRSEAQSTRPNALRDHPACQVPSHRRQTSSLTPFLRVCYTSLSEGQLLCHKPLLSQTLVLEFCLPALLELGRSAGMAEDHLKACSPFDLCLRKSTDTWTRWPGRGRAGCSSQTRADRRHPVLASACPSYQAGAPQGLPCSSSWRRGRRSRGRGWSCWSPPPASRGCCSEVSGGPASLHRSHSAPVYDLLHSFASRITEGLESEIQLMMWCFPLLVEIQLHEQVFPPYAEWVDQTSDRKKETN